MGSNFSLKYNVDIVMCIDATGSMNNLLDMVKTNALNFYHDLTGNMSEKGKHIDLLRVRIIAFRDYLADGRDAMLATDFYNLPEQASEFEKVLRSIKAKGGGDDPEDGLEALAYAMKSKWNTEGNKKRHIIIVWSDDGTHKLGFGQNPDNYSAYVNFGLRKEKAVQNAGHYPSKMAKNFEELTEWWGDSSQLGIMDNNAKRLLIYAPEKEYWTTIYNSWENVVHYPTEAGKGLEGVDYEQILNLIANSI